jgi:hypothetical protein
LKGPPEGLLCQSAGGVPGTGYESRQVTNKFLHLDQRLE